MLTLAARFLALADGLKHTIDHDLGVGLSRCLGGGGAASGSWAGLGVSLVATRLADQARNSSTVMPSANAIRSAD